MSPRLLLAGGLALLLASCAAVPIRHPDRLDDYEVTVRTADGWELAVFRWEPDPAAAAAPWFGTPVLLAHGTAVNRYNFATEDSNLAAYLAGRGFDVWLPEYRGDRSSRAPSTREWRAGEWSADDIAREDIPAVLDHVLATTGRQELWWVGHSLGGILGYMTAQGEHRDRIAGLVAIGAPGAFVHPNRVAHRASAARGLLPRHGQVPSRFLARLMVPTVDLAPDSQLLHVVFNQDNLQQGALLRFIREGMENVGRGMVEQYLGWMDSGQIVSLDGQVNYSEGLVGVDIPALLVAGRVDHIVPVWTVQEAYDRLGSEDKTLVILGVGWGERHDYGHGDLLVGDWVEEEVFPRIADWMELRLGRQPEPVPGAESAPSSPSEPGAAAPGIEDWGEEPGEAPDGLD